MHPLQLGTANQIEPGGNDSFGGDSEDVLDAIDPPRERSSASGSASGTKQGGTSGPVQRHGGTPERRSRMGGTCVHRDHAMRALQ